MRKILRGFRCAALVGAALLGVVSARADTENIRYYNPVTGEYPTRKCKIFKLGDFFDDYRSEGCSGWYVVKEKISAKDFPYPPTVNGKINLILCDDAELNASGGVGINFQYYPGIRLNAGNSLTIWGQEKGSGRLVAIGGEHSAGIGCDRDNYNIHGAGDLTIYGGNIEATGNGCAAGIGGSNYFYNQDTGGHFPWTGDYGSGGKVEIFGGKVTAKPGAGLGPWSYIPAGIGGAGYGPGGTVIVHGGTVVAHYGYPNENSYGIGWGTDTQTDHRQLKLQILGGSVNARTPLDRSSTDKNGAAKNERGDVLRYVTVNCDGLSGPLKIEGLDGYGSNDIYPDSGNKVYLWLPNGYHKFRLSNGTKGLLYEVNVKDAPTTASLVSVGFWVNNKDVGQNVGDGWTYGLDNVLTINKSGTFDISGYFENNAPQVNVAANNATVVLNGVYLGANNRPALVVQQGVSATLQMRYTPTLSATGGFPAMKVDGSLTVDLAGDADRDTSKINVSSSGSNAVSGGGKLTINDGMFCAQGGNNQSAIGLQDGKFALGQKVVMKAGMSPETPNYKPSYTTEWKGYAYVLVAPALTVTLEKVENVVGVVVYLQGKSSEKLEPTPKGGSVYHVMKNENLSIAYQSTDEKKYLVTGENPAKVTVTKDTTIGTDKLEVSAVQVLTDGSHYLESTIKGKQWIDTGWRPTKKARIEADFHSMTRSQEWGVFFGLTGYDSSSDGILLRYSAANTLNGWFCNGTYSEAEIGSLANTRILAELQAGSMILNGEKKGIKTEGDPCNKGSIYLFCGNNFEGGNEPHDWRHQEMKLFSFKIWDVENGEEKLVRDFVPFKTANGKVCGLYDLAKGDLYFNKATSGEPFQLGRDPSVRYRVWDDQVKEMRYRVCPNPIPVTAATTAFEKDKWYVVTNEVSCPTITVTGSAHLILCDGAKLTATGNGERAGIAVAAGQSLTIYGQRFGTGELEAKGGENCAGIGGGNYAAGGTVTIYGGKVSATGGWNGAGIGGGHSGTGGATTIYGGMVTATGTGGAAGIGGGNGENVKGGAVTINGGTVKATGDYQDALPEGYTAVEYIESTAGGNQYINTGYVPKKTTKVDCLVNVADNQPNYPSVVFGTQTAEGGRSKNNDNMSFFAWFRRQSTAYNRGTEEKQGKGFGYDKQVHLVCNGLNASWSSIDGLDSGEIDNAGPFNDCEDQNFPFYIFALDEPTGNPPYAPKDSTYLVMKLYSFKIYEGEELKRDFVPCVSASGAAGLYDTVEGKFYGNCGKNGDFKTGLPAGYERVEYIESTKGGGQYIDTGIAAKTGVKVEARALWTTENQDSAFIGARKDDGKTRFYPIWYFSGALSYGYKEWIPLSEAKVPANSVVDIVSDFSTAGQATIKVGNSEYKITDLGDAFDTGLTMYLGALNYRGSAGSYMQGRIYSCKIYEMQSGTLVLVRDFAPCVNTATGEAGLYDTVEGKFYGNAGAGRFTIAGSGAGGLGGKVTINGGNVKGGILGDMPKNAKDSTLCCVKVKMSEEGIAGSEEGRDGSEERGGKSEGGREVRIEGLGTYGLNDVQAIVNSYTGTPELYLWLPPGKHAFTVSDGTTTNSYFAVVSGHVQYMTVEPLKEANVWVNGKDIFKESGTGWSYDFVEGLLTLSEKANYVISGISLDGLVRIKVTADANVTFSNATFQASSDAVITVEGSHRLNLSAGNGENAAYLLGDGVNVIKGGTTVVENGSVCLWSTNAVPVVGTFSINPENEIMCVGKEESNLPYVKDYKPSETDRIILVAPRCRLAVPVVEHAEIKVSVQNPNAELLGKKGTGEGGIAVMVYELMLGDAATISCTLEENYVWIGRLDAQRITIDQAYVEVSRGDLPRIVGEGFTAHYREAKVDPDTAAVSYETKSEQAVLFDKIADTPGVVGQGAREEEWYVVTGKVRCASVCVTKGRVNLILYPGAELTLQGEDDQPGLGVMSNAWLTIYGCTNGVGTLVASGGSYAAGIGGGGGAVSEGAPGPDAGTITVNGGVVTAIGGDFGAGIGGGPHGKGAHLTVNGGTVFAYGGYDADDIGGGTYGKDGVTVVNGGNVMANSVEAKPVNAANEKLYRVYVVSEKFIPTNDVPLAVVGLNVYDTLVDLNGYGTADVFADDEDGVICFYLPNGHYEFTVDRWKCFAEVQDGTASATVSEERVSEERGGVSEERGGKSEERGGESGERGGESEEDLEVGDVWDGVDTAKVLGIEVGVPVKTTVQTGQTVNALRASRVGVPVRITVQTRVNWNYRLKRVTFEGGKMVVGDAIDFKTARSTSLTLEDDEPPAGAGFYVVEQSLK